MTSEAVLTAPAAGVRLRDAAPQLGLTPADAAPLVRQRRRWSLTPGSAAGCWFLNPEWVSAQVTWPPNGDIR